jgi:hypothetical protein
MTTNVNCLYTYRTEQGKKKSKRLGIHLLSSRTPTDSRNKVIQSVFDSCGCSLVDIPPRQSFPHMGEAIQYEHHWEFFYLHNPRPEKSEVVPTHDQ